MAKYQGTFFGRNNTEWKVEIIIGTDNTVAGELSFGEESVEIEWEETSKEDVICGSVATLHLISPGDRTYADLYTIKAGGTIVNIYRGGALYWQGTLDPETYEEPYTDTSDYEVTLTASDFGILNRLKYDLNGVKTLQEILSYALTQCCIEESIDTSMISLQLSDDDHTKYDSDILSKIAIRSENFTDEDGEESNLYDVIEGMLQPLGLRMIQKGGKICIYDINGIYNAGTTEAIDWASDDQTMGVDKVANKVKITFSPYAKSELLSGEIKYVEEASVGKINLSADKPSDGEYYSYLPNRYYNGSLDDHNISYTIHLSDNGSGIAYTDGKYFKIVNQLGGEESEGIAWCVWAGTPTAPSYGDIMQMSGTHVRLKTPQEKTALTVMKTNRIWLPPIDDASNYMLRLSMEVLIDPRYNPFSDGDKYNDKDLYDDIKEDWSYVFIPARITLYDKDSNALMYYDNRVAAQKPDWTPSFGQTTGEWKTGGETSGRFWLEYYDNESNRRHATGVLGWKTNRHTIGGCREDLAKSFTAMADGQYIPYPPEGGWIEIKIMEGIWAMCDIGWDGYTSFPLDSTTLRDTEGNQNKELDTIKWVLYKGVKLEVVSTSITNPGVESDDISYTGYINASAKDDIEIDSICGTMKNPIPTSKGVYINSTSGKQIKELYREGRSGLAEKLLIGTLHSQFASRKLKLMGTAFLPSKDLKLMTDASSVGKKLLVLAAVEDEGEETSEITAVEIRPDEWDEKNEE